MCYVQYKDSVNLTGRYGLAPNALLTLGRMSVSYPRTKNAVSTEGNCVSQGITI